MGKKKNKSGNKPVSSEFDDTFEDDGALHKISKTDSDLTDDDVESEYNDDDIGITSGVILKTIVLNVAFTGSDDFKIVRFDLAEYTPSGAYYTSRFYNLSLKYGGGGIFELLNDYYMHRFTFLYSSKSCQAFMLALAKAELDFNSKFKSFFIDYCENIMNNSIARIADTVIGKNPTDDILHRQYGICDESRMYFVSQNIQYNDEHAEFVNDKLLSYFNHYMNFANTKHFCAICIQHNSDYDIHPNILEDPSISKPFIAYIPSFIDIFCKKAAHEFLDSDIFKNVGIEKMNVDVYLLMPNTTLGDILSIINDDLEVKNYDDIENSDFITAKFKSYTFTEDEYIDSEDSLDSIICYS